MITLESVLQAFDCLYPGERIFKVGVAPLSNRIKWLPRLPFNAVFGETRGILGQDGRRIVTEIILDSRQSLKEAPVTLAHELAHTIVPGAGHGKSWEDHFFSILHTAKAIAEGG